MSGGVYDEASWLTCSAADAGDCGDGSSVASCCMCAAEGDVADSSKGWVNHHKTEWQVEDNGKNAVSKHFWDDFWSTSFVGGTWTGTAPGYHSDENVYSAHDSLTNAACTGINKGKLLPLDYEVDADSTYATCWGDNSHYCGNADTPDFDALCCQCADEYLALTVRHPDPPPAGSDAETQCNCSVGRTTSLGYIMSKEETQFGFYEAKVHIHIQISFLLVYFSCFPFFQYPSPAIRCPAIRYPLSLSALCISLSRTFRLIKTNWCQPSFFAIT